MRAAALFCLLSAACATDRHFAPRENRNGEGPSGEPAAVYALAPPLQGEVRLWSDGAARTEIDGKDATRVHVGFESGVSVGFTKVIEAVGASDAGTREIWRFLLGIDWMASVKADLAKRLAVLKTCAGPTCCTPDCLSLIL